MGAQPRDRLAEDWKQTPYFGFSTAWEHQNERGVGMPTPRFVGAGAKRSYFFDEGVADVGARRPTQALKDIRLERQHRQYVVDITAHAARPPRPPSPHRRRYIIDDGD